MIIYSPHATRFHLIEASAGYDDWRLPTTPGTITGPVNEGEMGHLYYDEEVTYSSPPPLANAAV
jgi:hypothetical protein